MICRGELHDSDSKQSSADNYSKSIFGMNVKEPLFPGPSDSKASISSPFLKSAPSVTVDPSEPSQHYWTISQYLEISLSLTTAVILLPLIGGACFRWTIQKFNEAYLRQLALFVVFAPSYLTSIIVLYATDPVAYLGWSYAVLGLTCVIRVVWAYGRKESRLRWSILLLIFSVCLVLEFKVKVQVLWALVPCAYMFLTSRMVIRSLKRRGNWFSWRSSRQSVTHNPGVTLV
jgi:hypothetical protein